MTPEQFAYWLQGFVELTQDKVPTLAQWKSIGEHLGQVFDKKTPPVGNNVSTLLKREPDNANKHTSFPDPSWFPKQEPKPVPYYDDYRKFILNNSPGIGTGIQPGFIDASKITLTC